MAICPLALDEWPEPGCPGFSAAQGSPSCLQSSVIHLVLSVLYFRAGCTAVRLSSEHRLLPCVALRADLVCTRCAHPAAAKSLGLGESAFLQAVASRSLFSLRSAVAVLRAPRPFLRGGFLARLRAALIKALVSALVWGAPARCWLQLILTGRSGWFRAQPGLLVTLSERLLNPPSGLWLRSFGAYCACV